MRITREPNPAEGAVTLLISGTVSEDALGELEQFIDEAAHVSQRIYIDLSEVTLLDRAAALWFSRRDLNNIVCINCPVYIKRWISM
jgi:ABC-type transporter Mla MlaB component